MEKEKGLAPVEIKILAALVEMQGAGVFPSKRGLLFFLRGEEPAADFSLLFTFGAYLSMGPKRLGRLLGGLEKEGYIRPSEKQGETYLLPTPKGEKEGRIYLDKPHKKKAGIKERPPLYYSPRAL